MGSDANSGMRSGPSAWPLLLALAVVMLGAVVVNLHSEAILGAAEISETGLEGPAFKGSSPSLSSFGDWQHRAVRFFAGAPCNLTAEDTLATGQSCDEVCLAQGRICDVSTLAELNSEARIRAAAAQAGHRCRTALPLAVQGAWEGPWHSAGHCAFTASRQWTPTCGAPKPSCGLSRLCPCREVTTTPLPAALPLRFAADSSCTETEQGQKESSCDEVCAKQGLGCNVRALQRINTEASVKLAAELAGRRCDTFEREQVAGQWDGPWINSHLCSYNVDSGWVPSCTGPRPACGFHRICPCDGQGVARVRGSTSTTTRPPATTFAKPSAWDGVHFTLTLQCEAGASSDQKEPNCEEVCAGQGMTCDGAVLEQLDQQERVRYAAAEAGVYCRSFLKQTVEGDWDGPWFSEGRCAYYSSRTWKPTCSGLRSACGYSKICPCRARPNTSEAGPGFRSGGPVWPAEAASSYRWAEAAGRVLDVPPRLPGLREKIWARAAAAARPPCGQPCVAHCIAGQPRELLENVGLAKTIRHRLIERLSPNAVTFGVFVASAMMSNGKGEENSKDFVRSGVSRISAQAMVPRLEYMGVDRALFISEPCVTGGCLQKSAGLVCDARALDLTAQYDTRDNKLYTVCDVQVRRFQTCMHLVREYEREHNIRFDWVSRARPDVWWWRPASNTPGPGILELRNDRMYWASWATCGYGGGDWFYIAPRHIADIAVRMPDEMTCDKLHHPKILPNPCRTCMGCECMLAAWLYSQNVIFESVPWPHVGLIPMKFCGCPEDWNVTAQSIENR